MEAGYVGFYKRYVVDFKNGSKNRLEYLILVNIIHNFTFCSK